MARIIEASARTLYERLKPTGIVSTVAPGRRNDEPALCVYTTEPPDKRLRQQFQLWDNFRVVWRRKRGSE